MRARHLIIVWGVALVATVGCTEFGIVAPTGDFELPEPDLSLDPERLTIGEYIATPCAFGKGGDGLADLRDRDEWALVDIFFGRASPDASSEGPSASELSEVESHGGQPLHSFNVPAVRARIILSKIPDLVRNGFWITVRDVPDASRYDLDLMVGFSGPITEADLDLVTDLGGRVNLRLDASDMLSIYLPDRMVPELRNRSNVTFVEVNGVTCVA